MIEMQRGSPSLAIRLAILVQTCCASAVHGWCGLGPVPGRQQGHMPPAGGWVRSGPSVLRGGMCWVPQPLVLAAHQQLGARSGSSPVDAPLLSRRISSGHFRVPRGVATGRRLVGIKANVEVSSGSRHQGYHELILSHPRSGLTRTMPRKVRGMNWLKPIRRPPLSSWCTTPRLRPLHINHAPSTYL